MTRLSVFAALLALSLACLCVVSTHATSAQDVSAAASVPHTAPRSSRLSDSVHAAKFARFVAANGRRYASREEAATRFKLFKENREEIAKLNDEFSSHSEEPLFSSTSPHADLSASERFQRRGAGLHRDSGPAAESDTAASAGAVDVDAEVNAAAEAGVDLNSFVDVSAPSVLQQMSSENESGSSDAVLLEATHTKCPSAGKKLTKYCSSPSHAWSSCCKHSTKTCHLTFSSASKKASWCKKAKNSKHACCKGQKKKGPPVLPVQTLTVNYMEHMTPVKNQGGCAACWAHSATEQMESRASIAGFPLQKGARQQLVDCTPNALGCNGGLDVQVFSWLQKAGVHQELESAFPYTGTWNEKCSTPSGSTSGFSVGSHAYVVPPCGDYGKLVPKGSCTNRNGTTTEDLEAEMLAHLEAHGPFGITVNSDKLDYASSGILTAKACSGDNWDQMDHQVLLAGYGVDQGRKYWLVRNSWGAHWAEQGYIRLEYGKNTCGVTNYANAAFNVTFTE